MTLWRCGIYVTSGILWMSLLDWPTTLQCENVLTFVLTICMITGNDIWFLNWWYCMFVMFSIRTDCCFSPDDKLLVTGTSVKKDEGNGKLAFFERASFQKVYEIEVTNAVSPASVSTATTALIARCFFQLVNMICWLQTKMTQNNVQWKRNLMNPQWNIMKPMCMSFLLHVSSLGSHKTAALKCFYLL